MPSLCLGAGQRRLDLGTAREKGQLAERRAHRRGAEHVAEQAGGQNPEGRFPASFGGSRVGWLQDARCLA